MAELLGVTDGGGGKCGRDLLPRFPIRAGPPSEKLAPMQSLQTSGK